MEIIWELLKVSVPSIITGFVTWNVAMHNNRHMLPLEKYKIAYNRIYYPLYLSVSSKDFKDIDHLELQKQYDDIIKKYKKYIAYSTEKTYYRYLEDLKYNKIGKKKSYTLFQNNVIEYNFKLRKSLGYLQDNVFVGFKYMETKKKKWVEFGVLYCILGLFAFIHKFISNDITQLLYAVAFLFTMFKLASIVLLDTFEDMFYKIRNAIERVIAVIKSIIQLYNIGKIDRIIDKDKKRNL